MTKEPLTAAAVNELVAGLNKLSRNLWWCWDQEAQDLFQELSPRGWQNLFHNAVAVLREVSDYELRVRLQDADFAGRVRSVLDNLTRISRTRTPGAISTRRSCTKIPSRIFPPSSVFTNRCRFRRAVSAFSPATTRSPRATSASVSSASVCSTAKVIFSRRLTPTTGRRNFTIRWTRRTCRSNRWWTPRANASCARWRSA